MSIDSIGSNSTVNLLGMDDVVALELGGNVEAEVSQTLVQSARFQRNQGELERAGTEQRLANAEQRQIDEMHEQAHEVRMAGWSKGLGEIASGALGAGAAFMKSDKAVAVMKGGAKAFEGVGELFGAMHDAKKVDNQADATAAGNAADHLKRQLDELSRVANDAANQIESAIDRAGQGVQIQAQQGSALVFIRG